MRLHLHVEFGYGWAVGVRHGVTRLGASQHGAGPLAAAGGGSGGAAAGDGAHLSALGAFAALEEDDATHAEVEVRVHRLAYHQARIPSECPPCAWASGKGKSRVAIGRGHRAISEGATSGTAVRVLP